MSIGNNSDSYLYKDKRMLRCGFTTGTCAAIAAQAAVMFLETGVWSEYGEIITPDGSSVRTEILEKTSGMTEISCEESTAGCAQWAECAVKKDAGDDPDVTDGMLIFARAEFPCDNEDRPDLHNPGDGEAFEKRGLWDPENGSISCESEFAVERVLIDGGEGIGRVTKPGLDQPVGAAAINSVPRKMIGEAVMSVLDEFSDERNAKITISAPGGEEIAVKTFNPRLGIEGGISILGTSGIVRPMSDEAIIDTIRAELSVHRAEGFEYAAVSPGNMGERFLKRLLGGNRPKEGGSAVNVSPYGEQVTTDPISCSNFIGRTIDIAGELGFSGLVIGGHIGKLVKLGNGIMNTHSHEGDARMDTLISCALSAGAERDILLNIQRANTTDETVDILEKTGLKEETMKILTDRAEEYVKRRAADTLKTAVIIFDAAGNVLGESADARMMLSLALVKNLDI